MDPSADTLKSFTLVTEIAVWLRISDNVADAKTPFGALFHLLGLDPQSPVRELARLPRLLS